MRRRIQAGSGGAGHGQAPGPQVPALARESCAGPRGRCVIIGACL